MNPRYQRWLDSLLYVGAMAVIIACILMAYIALTGCSSMSQGFGRGVTSVALDRLDSKINYLSQQYVPPSKSISEGGVAAIMAAINGLFGLFYLVRKRWFPMGKR